MAAHISNSPSFSLQRQRSEKVGRLQLLSNLVPGACWHASCFRHVVWSCLDALGAPLTIGTDFCFMCSLRQFKRIMFAGERPERNVVLATSLTPESAAALTWAVQNFCRSGDAVHLVHVVRCLSTPSEVQHAASYSQS